MADKYSSVSLREKLGTLVKKFVRFMDDNKNIIFNFATLVHEACSILKDFKRSLEILFYFEGLGIITRVTENHVVFVGLRGMIRKLYEYETDPTSTRINTAIEIQLSGRLTNVKSYVLGGSLLASIFYKLIYEKETIAKSSVEDMVETFMMQQKDLNAKNFVQESLNILTNLGLIEKDESTEVITYVGPDLRCYEENGKKVSWKIYDLLQREEQILGREIEEKQEPKRSNKNKKLPVPMHISHYPEMGYAVLRSSNWEQYITKTAFFIGRSEKRQVRNGEKVRSHQVDLELPYHSISRQHALILFNSEAGKWEIRCLSRKNMIKVDDDRIAWGDKNVWIKNRTEICIGPEKMVFLEANPEL